jgi:DNA-binding response OmpR family regulator
MLCSFIAMAKIFVLEDDQDIREVVEWILASEDYEVVSFDSVADFMQRDARDLPDLFILDVRLPDGSGLDICKQLRSEDTHQAIPILMMSAHANIIQMERQCDADGFIQKPFELNHFLETIHLHLKATQ